VDFLKALQFFYRPRQVPNYKGQSPLKNVGIPNVLAEWIATLGLSAIQLILCLTIFFIALGCFLDGISVIVLTTSVVLPMVTQSGINPIWFGIFLALVVEMSQITPPVGFNLFMIAIVLITIYPSIALYLPTLMTS
jgi:C4-dicarboxylate transporter DctM subunit